MKEGIIALPNPGEYIYSTPAGVELTIAYSSTSTENKASIKKIGKFEIAEWGKDNNLPLYRENTIMENPIVGELISTKASIIRGKGLQAYTQAFVDGEEVIKLVEMPKPAKEFFEENDWEDLLERWINDLATQANGFVEGYRGTAALKSKITKIKLHASKKIRAGKQGEDGRVHNYYWNPKWGDQKLKNKTIQVQTYDKEKMQPKFMWHTGLKLFHDGYYYHPPYWGSEQWILLSNAIPKFHNSNIENGYNIRFHVEIPKNYFLDKFAYDNASEDKDRQACIDKAIEAEKLFITKMNEFLAGVANAGRAVFTKYDVDKQMAKEFPGIRITAIKYDMKDESLLKLFEKSQEANISAHGIHPALASVSTQGKLSSGSEIRNALLFFIGIKAKAYRSQILSVVHEIKRINQWPSEVYFQFKDVVIAKLDDDKSAGQEEVAV